MGILARFSDIISSNVNALLDKCEDPAKMCDQYLRNAIEDLAEVKSETAKVMAQEKAAKRSLDDAKAGVDKYSKLAEKAIIAGNDDDARTFLAKKQELEAGLVTLQQSYDLAHANSEKMRQMHNKLAADIETLKSRRDAVKAQVAVTKTQNVVNKAASAGDKVTGALGAFARMEEKAQKEADAAMAMAELNTPVNDDLKSAEDRYSGVNSSSVDDELAALKAKLSGSEG